MNSTEDAGHRLPPAGKMIYGECASAGDGNGVERSMEGASFIDLMTRWLINTLEEIGKQKWGGRVRCSVVRWTDGESLP